MESLLNRYRGLTLLLVVLFAQLILVAYQVKTDHDVRLIRVWAVSTMLPPARLLAAVRTATTQFFSNYFLLVGAKEENRRLTAELDKLKMENRYLRSELGTAERAGPLSMFQASIPSATVAARVIGAGSGVNARAVFVDRGSSSGVKAGMAVITPDGVVGKVTAAYPSASQVLLIIDQGFSAGVVSAKEHVEGIVKGRGGPECRVAYVRNDEKIAVGEWFYTSGEDRIFPRGLPVGRVKSVGGDKVYKEIVLAPSGMARGLEEVLIVTGAVHQSIPDEQPATATAPLLPPPITQAPAAAPAEGQPAKPASLGTDADRLLEQYKKRAQSRGGAYGDNPEGLKPAEPSGGSGQAPARGATPAVKPPVSPSPPKPDAAKP